MEWGYVAENNTNEIIRDPKKSKRRIARTSTRLLFKKARLAETHPKRKGVPPGSDPPPGGYRSSNEA